MRSRRILMVTRLFPSAAFATLGTFCAERARALSLYAEVRVLVPTPWWPASLPFGPWKSFAKVERERVTPEGVSVQYPRYLSIPRMAAWTQGHAIARSICRHMAQQEDGWRPDIVDGHFAFPDGYGAVRLAKALRCPVLVTCHGSDLREYPTLAFVSSMLRWTFEQASRVIVVSPALGERALALGATADKVAVLPNGVDTELFRVQDKGECRKQLGLPEKEVIGVCVGALCDRKDQGILVRSLGVLKRQGIRPPMLVLVGDGPNMVKVRREVLQLGLQDHVLLAGARPYAEIPSWLGAADWLLLSSHYEGWPTVYFEAMACGRPVITSNVASAETAVCDSRFGMVVRPNTPEAFANALREAQRRTFDVATLRAYAERHSWDRWANEAMALIGSACEEYRA